MKFTVVALLVTVVGCVNSSSRQCGDVTCGDNAVCSPHGGCVLAANLAACEGKPDGTDCTAPATEVGVCLTDVCIEAGCGNGYVEAGETCDDGNRVSFDGCSSDCMSAEVCGDGKVDAAFGELCDCGTDADNAPTGCQGANSAATDASCRTDCTLARCGDGIVDNHEFCDDGNTTPGDGCRADCQGRWTRMTSNTLTGLRDVSAYSPDDAWAVGDRRVLHWNGSVWTSLTDATVQGHRFARVYAFGPNDMFVTALGLLGGPTKMLRNQNGAWTDVTPTTSVQPVWQAIAGSGSTVWISGFDNLYKFCAVGHWNGTTFVDDGVPFGGCSAPLDSLTVASDGTPYAATSANGLVATKTGSTWTTFSSQLGRIISVTSGDDMFAFGTALEGLHAPTRTAGAFTTLVNSFELPSPNDAMAVPNFAIEVGYGGSVMLCDATTCTASDTGTSTDLAGVWVLDDKHAFIVGEGGTILY